MVNHFSVELLWETALKEANQAGRGRGLVKVHLQYKDENMGHMKEWVPCYTGMAKKFVVSDLSPKSKYTFRYQFQQKGQASEWSPPTTVTSAREPMYGENLHMAIRKQNLSELEEVLKSGEVSPDVQNADGFTALMAAAKKSDTGAMELLIQYGADVNYRNTAGKTALMVACTACSLQSVRKLREHSADYHLYDNGGCTAVHWAVDTGNRELVELVAKDGANLDIKDRGHSGWTPLMRCALMNGNREVGLTLMMNGADLSATDNYGNTALHHAVTRQHGDLIKVMLAKKANPLIPNKESTTPWKIACSFTDDRRGIVAMLQKSVDDINAKRKTAAFQDAKANALQITSGLQKPAVAFQVK
ncbi:hypothetical protein ACOMHN_062761 [Nucella lapillus]